MTSLPLSLEFHLIQPSDLEIVEEMVLAGFGGSPGRQSELNRLLKLQPDSWFIARRGADPVGMGGAMLYDHFAYINMMIVFPQAQRQGIGSAVFEHILSLLDRRGYPLALLDATPMGEPLYRKYGFVEIDQARQFLCQQPPHRQHPHPSIDALSAKDLPEVAAFDAPIFGANRLKVFEAFLADYPGRLLAKRSPRGEISGYLLAQPSRLGPWSALTPDDAADLMDAALSLPFQNTLDVIVPAANPHAEALFLASGFHFERALPHMKRGTFSVTPQRHLLYGQTSFALG